jgi:hypothetical protein
MSKQNSTASGNRPENAADKIAKFMSRVVAWPNADGPGYINLEWQAKNARLGKTIWTGKPVKEIGAFLALADQMSHEGSVTNIYFCLSQQSQAVSSQLDFACRMRNSVFMPHSLRLSLAAPRAGTKQKIDAPLNARFWQT